MKDRKTIIEEILTEAIFGSANANKEKEEETPNFRDEARKIGNMLFATYLGFQDAGFTPEQAFELTLAMRD